MKVADSEPEGAFGFVAMAQTGLEERMAKIEGAITQIGLRLGRVETELVELRRHMIGAVRDEIKSVRNDPHGETGSLHAEADSFRREISSVRKERHAKIDSLY